jgi:putative ABC transport system permease protein
VSYAKIADRELKSAAGPAPLGEALLRDLPEVQAYTRIWNWGGQPWITRCEGKIFSEKRLFAVDSSFFNVFTTQFISGDPKTALVQPKSLVLTESTAHRYFGNKNPVGKIINLNKNRDFVVTGVIKDNPGESHFHYDLLASFSSFNVSRNTYWGNLDCYTYLLLKGGTKEVQFEKKMNDEFKKYFSPQLKAATGLSFEQFIAAGYKNEFKIEPLTSIHLHSHLDEEIESNSDMSYIYIFSAIAAAILLIACINFINLSTARSEKRAKEVGIRKSLGSHKQQITDLFIAESILTSFISVIFSIGIVELLLPFFNNLSNKQINFNFLSTSYLIPLLLFITLVVGFAAGFYPAFYMSSFQPVQILKSNLKTGNSKSNLRRGLVIIQFAISIMLIISTFVIYNQLLFIQKKDIGFNKEQIVIINKISDAGNTQSFIDDILTNPQIAGVSSSNAIPSKLLNMSSFYLKGAPVLQFQNMNTMYCDYQFKNVYKIKMAAGRFFSMEHPADTAAAIINESAARRLGINNIEGKYLVEDGNRNYEIIGIVKDFNFMSLHEAIQPLVIYPYKPGSNGDYLSVKIKPGAFAGTISFLKNTWRKYAGNEALDYSPLDKNLENLYTADISVGKLISAFSTLAILIACLGLFGLVTFITEQKTKEIGIRKVLGASISEIIIMLSKEFAKWVLIANIVAWPAAYYLMNNWLKEFAYRINIAPWVFIISGALALVIALLTVSANAVKAATANPVKSLKYE